MKSENSEANHTSLCSVDDVIKVLAKRINEITDIRPLRTVRVAILSPLLPHDLRNYALSSVMQSLLLGSC